MAMKFGQFLNHLIESKGLTATDLARKLDLSPGYIINVQNGHRRPPPPERLEQISKILNLTPEQRNKLFDLSIEERYLEKNPLLREYGLGGPTPKPITIKDVKIPVVSMAKGDDMDGFEFEQLEAHEYTYIDFKNCKAVQLRGNSMAPLAYDGQKVIYSEGETVKEGDLVFVSIKKRGQFFKRYHKDAKSGIITLLSINIANHGPITTRADEIEFMYKVVGVKF